MIRRRTSAPVRQPAPSGLQEVMNMMREMRTLKAEMTKVITEVKRQKSSVIRGERGLPGFTPKKGVDYTDGYTPIKGVDYFDGKPGRPGRDGKDADETAIAQKVIAEVRNGDEEMKKGIVDKVLTTLREYVDKQVRSLRDEMNRRIVSSSGGVKGGMGTIKYFKFTGDGGTTGFQLPDVPTQDGAATFAFYQGSRLHYDEHYTVSGRTLTTTFIPENNQVVDGWIIT